MTFLAPVAMAVAAALAFPALLALYLLKLRRRPVRVSAALFWPVAREEVQANVPFARPRFSWLLVLHFLALACGVLALGRPALVGTGPDGRERVIVLLDRGASMSAADTPEGKSRLERAKDAAQALIDAQSRGGESSQMAIIVFGAEASAVSSFTTSRSLLKAAVRAITPTDQPSRLGPAMDVARALAGDGEELGATCVLISDGGISDLGKVGAAPGVLKYQAIGGEGAGIDNLGIVAFAGERDAQEPSVVRLFAQVINTNPAPVSVGVVLSLGETELLRRGVEVPGAGQSGPGALALPLEARLAQAGVLSLRLERPDALASDNQAWLVLPEAARPLLWLVRPEGAGGGERVPAGSWMLEAALAEMRVAGVVVQSPEEYESRAQRGGVQGVGLVVFDRVTPATKPPVPSLVFGGFVPAAGLDKVPGELGATPAVFWSREHPVTRSLALDTLDIAGGLNLKVTSRDSIEVVRGTDGALVVASNDGGVARLVVGFDLTRSNWTIQTSFPVFLASAIDWLTRRGEATKCAAFVTGEPVRVFAPGGGDVTVTPQGGPGLSVRANGPGELQLGFLERVGAYEVKGPGAVGNLAMNLCDAGESTLAKVSTLEVAGRVIQAGGVSPGRREVWQWLVLAGLVLLTIEWVAFARAMASPGVGA